MPVGAGPGGHTQRLLTVVKSGSIQEAKAAPVDKVHTWPHLLAVEFVAALALTAFLFVFSWVVNAPLMQAADFNKTPNLQRLRGTSGIAGIVDHVSPK